MQPVNMLKQAFMTKRDGQRNFDALQNTQLTAEVEAGLLNAIQVKTCPVYSFSEIQAQEKTNCGYKFTDGSFVQPV